MATIKVQILYDSVEEQELLNRGGALLHTLCQKEVESFDAFLREWGASQPLGAIDHDFAVGLARWERAVIEGYLYQKLRGHVK